MRVRGGLIQLKMRPVWETENTVMNLHDQLLKKNCAPRNYGNKRNT